MKRFHSGRNASIYPIKSEGKVDMDRQFMHLTCEETIEEDENGIRYPKRVFDKDRLLSAYYLNREYGVKEIKKKLKKKLPLIY